MGRHQPTDDEVRSGAGWGVVGLAAVACMYAGMVTDNGRLVVGGLAALILAGLIGSGAS